MMRRLLTLALATSSSALCGYAGVCPAPLIGKNMVLQQGTEVPICGKADLGERITVSFCGQEKSAVASAEGRWKVMLGPLKAGGPFEMRISGKSAALVFGNVMVGEVWVCSGQSNMAFAMRKAASAEEETPKADYPGIRYFRAEAWTSEKPAETVRGKWQVCTAENVVDFSAVAYFLARRLHPSRKKEVGERLALAALGTVYGKDIVWSGPLFHRLTRAGNKLRITFKYVGSGLTTNDSKPLRDFAVAGADGNFTAATAEIQGNAVVVWSEGVKAPVSVRYSWADYPAGNLLNKEGLPASPFAASLD